MNDTCCWNAQLRRHKEDTAHQANAPVAPQSAGLLALHASFDYGASVIQASLWWVGTPHPRRVRVVESGSSAVPPQPSAWHLTRPQLPSSPAPVLLAPHRGKQLTVRATGAELVPIRLPAAAVVNRQAVAVGVAVAVVGGVGVVVGLRIAPATTTAAVGHAVPRLVVTQAARPLAQHTSPAVDGEALQGPRPTTAAARTGTPPQPPLAATVAAVVNAVVVVVVDVAAAAAVGRTAAVRVVPSVVAPPQLPPRPP